MHKLRAGLRTNAIRLYYILVDLKSFLRILYAGALFNLRGNIKLLLPRRAKMRKKLFMLRRILRLTANGWTAHKLTENIFEFRNSTGYIVIQPDIGVLDEDLLWWIPPPESGCAIDIGGYRGETALCLAMRGYKRIIVFEPVEENVKLVLENIKRNKKRLQDTTITVYPVGVGASEGIVYVSSAVPPGDPGFGTASKASKYRAKIEVWSWQRVLSSMPCEALDLVKVDCEGCERTLLALPKSVVRRAKWWVIETHDRTTEGALLERFAALGYVCIKYRRMGPETTLVVLRRRD